MIGIVGAGPAGLFATENLGRCVVLEEDQEVGMPEECGGLISVDGLKELGVYDKGYILNEVKGARFFSPHEEFTVERKERQAAVISRKLFDQYLLARAEKAGAEVLTGCRVTGIKREGGKVVVEADKDYPFNGLILACGHNPSLVRDAGLEPYPNSGLLKTMQADCEMEMDADYVELYFDTRIAKGFFGWRIPRGDGIVRVGVGSIESPIEGFERFLKKFDAVPERKFGAVIPIEGPLGKTSGKDVVLVGDAAGHVKPTTGGGVVMGMMCAKIAAKSIENPEAYELMWREALEKEFQLGLLIHEFRKSMGNTQLDQVFKIIKKDLVHIIEEYGHMDRPSVLFRAMDKDTISRIAALFGKSQ